MGSCFRCLFHSNSDINTNEPDKQNSAPPKPEDPKFIQPPAAHCPPKIPQTEANLSIGSKRRSIEVKPTDISPANSMVTVFNAYSGGSEILTMEDGGLVIDFFNWLEFPLERGDGFVAFYLMNAQDFSQLRLQEVQAYCSK